MTPNDDESGSAQGPAGDDRTLETFFAEIYGIWRTDAEVVVIECDTAVQLTSIYRARPAKITPNLW
jgi:hypothetical protein